MKKIYIALAVLAAATLVSCVKEMDDNNGSLTPVGKNTLAFMVNNGAKTRAGGEDAIATTRGVTIPLGNVVNGPSFYLEETVSTMDASAPITRGTPAYTENIGVLYRNNLAIYSPDGTFGTATMENMDSDQIESGGWRYQHTYSSDPWPAGTARFYLRMPATQAGVDQTTGYSYPADGQISFVYTSPATAAAQQDILFAYTELTKQQHNDYLPNGAPILFNHALTGVKFAIGNEKGEISYNASDKKLAITEISFKGLKDHGTCVITPAPSGSDPHVSATAAVWDPSTLSTTLDSLSSGTYADTVLFRKGGGSFGDAGGDYPASFSAAGNARNLGDSTATQTFWLIPQAITEDVQLTIKYTYAGTQNYWVIDLGSILAAANVEWKAGQIRTYTIKVDEVNLKIEDEVTMATGDKIVGSKKTGVAITNTGNTDVFIRAAIVGQWLDPSNNPVFGFTDLLNQLYEVESWYEDQFVNHTGEHGVFDDLPGYVNNNTQWPRSYGNSYHDWVYNPNDRYYYYTKSVAPGEETGYPLFSSYEVKKVPEARNAGELLSEGMYFTLEISTQAISARNLDGTLMDDADYAAAWAAALRGEKPEL